MGKERIFTKYIFQFGVRFSTVFIIFAILNLTVGCSYYQVNRIQPPQALTENRINDLNNRGKNFYILFAGQSRSLHQLMLNEDQTALLASTANFSPATSNLPADEGVYRYRGAEGKILQEVHIHVHEFVELGNGKISIPLTAIERIDVFDKAQGATIASWVFGIAGILLGAYLLLWIIVILTKTSCPFVYEYDGSHFHFAGEIFSGAVQPSMERNDYLLLQNLKASENQYKIKVANEIVNEVQHINLLQLLAVDHPAHMKVLADKYGTIHTLSDARQPIAAETFSGRNVLQAVTEKDNMAYHCDDASERNNALDGMILTFEKPEDAINARLMLRAKNSFWIENVMNEFHAMFGNKYERFRKKQEKDMSGKHRQWMTDQNLPVKVYVEIHGEWVYQDMFEIAGPMAMKEDVLSINLQNVTGDAVKVKLETGFLFWDFDQVAIDFSENIPVKTTVIIPSEATCESGTDLKPMIAADDKLYYTQPKAGNEAVLVFDVPEMMDESRTLILHSKGWYKVERNPEGKAKIRELQTFQNPGRLPQYSKELYLGVTRLVQNNKN
jgi:hypothetical protein